MIYAVTYIEVQPSSVPEGIAILNLYREGTAAETGNARVVVLQEASRRNRFVAIEIWKDQAAFEGHDAAGQTAQFRSKLQTIHNAPYDQRLHGAFAIGPESSHGPQNFFTVTHVDVPPPRREETEVLLARLAQQARKDNGNLRFDIFQQNAPRTNHFTVAAIWTNEAAFISHQTAGHTRQFREGLGPMLGAPYDERLFALLFG
jgi:quinol monooxygenase YgiN